ncbi:hypothetical protein ACIBUY_28115 [Streptomyces sp. NPDC050085]|uniref:hypothetical protein n=1 Tax=Streptomyces sp. NPDC050085 TaxID=3365600 RepID=UPI0037BA927A
MTAHISRRTALLRGAAIAAGVALGSQALVRPGYAADTRPSATDIRTAMQQAKERRDHALAGQKSLNGWEMEKVTDNRGNIYTRPVPGTGLDAKVRMGDVETVLTYVIRRFHYEIDELRRGDVVGWLAPDQVNHKRAESNLASGTAVRIRPGHYPPGQSGGFFPTQKLLVGDILAQCDGIVAWGGEDRIPDESLFSIKVGPDDKRLASTAEKLRVWDLTPGKGAGAEADMNVPAQRARARQHL